MKHLLFIPLFISLFVSCGDGKPSENEAKKEAEELVNKVSEGNVVLTEFKKVDAEENNMYGKQLYNIDFEGKITYKKDGFVYKYAYKGLSVSENNILIIRDEPSEYSKDSFVKVKKGEIREVSGRISYKKKESGWNLEKGNIIRFKKED